MKNLYPKAKGKIHPSPASPAGGGGSAEALAVLRLLPAAILALTAVLGAEDKEVLAYLITRSVNGPASLEGRRCRRSSVGHQAALDCGCFDCYTSFWSRWDCSPDRELIHQAIEGFEDHLASSERTAKGRRRDRIRSEKGKKKAELNSKAEGIAGDEPSSPPALEITGEVFSGEVELGEDTAETAEVEVEEEEEEMAAEIAGERRRGWPDVMGVFNSRLWSLWSPGA